MSDKTIDELETAHEDASAKRSAAKDALCAHVEANRAAIQEVHRLDYIYKRAGVAVSDAYDALCCGYAAAMAAQRATEKAEGFVCIVCLSRGPTRNAVIHGDRCPYRQG